MDTSQYGEAAILCKYFDNVLPKHKYLVDIGTFGIEMSNTSNLIAEHDWGGLLIEPFQTQEYWIPLYNAMMNRPKVKLLNCAVGDEDKMARYYVHEKAGHGSLVRESKSWFEVQMRSLKTLFDEHEVPLDFDLLTVDTEGMDYRIIKFMFGHTLYRPRVIVFEKGDDEIDCGIILQVMGYEILFETIGNKGYVKKGRLLK